VIIALGRFSQNGPGSEETAKPLAHHGLRLCSASNLQSHSESGGASYANRFMLISIAGLNTFAHTITFITIPRPSPVVRIESSLGSIIQKAVFQT
jgi:hypothetical protein